MIDHQYSGGTTRGRYTAAEEMPEIDNRQQLATQAANAPNPASGARHPRDLAGVCHDFANFFARDEKGLGSNSKSHTDPIRTFG